MVTGKITWNSEISGEEVSSNSKTLAYPKNTVTLDYSGEGDEPLNFYISVHDTLTDETERVSSAIAEADSPMAAAIVEAIKILTAAARAARASTNKGGIN